MNVLDLLAKGFLPEDLERIRMMLPNRMPMVAAFVLSAEFEKRVLEAILLQVLNDPSCCNAIQKTQDVRHCLF